MFGSYLAALAADSGEAREARGKRGDVRVPTELSLVVTDQLDVASCVLAVALAYVLERQTQRCHWPLFLFACDVWGVRHDLLRVVGAPAARALTSFSQHGPAFEAVFARLAHPNCASSASSSSFSFPSLSSVSSLDVDAAPARAEHNKEETKETVVDVHCLEMSRLSLAHELLACRETRCWPVGEVYARCLGAGVVDGDTGFARWLLLALQWQTRGLTRCTLADLGTARALAATLDLPLGDARHAQELAQLELARHVSPLRADCGWPQLCSVFGYLTVSGRAPGPVVTAQVVQLTVSLAQLADRFPDWPQLLRSHLTEHRLSLLLLALEPLAPPFTPAQASAAASDSKRLTHHARMEQSKRRRRERQRHQRETAALITQHLVLVAQPPELLRAARDFWLAAPGARLLPHEQVAGMLVLSRPFPAPQPSDDDDEDDEKDDNKDKNTDTDAPDIPNERKETDGLHRPAAALAGRGWPMYSSARRLDARSNRGVVEFSKAYLQALHEVAHKKSALSGQPFPSQPTPPRDALTS